MAYNNLFSSGGVSSATGTSPITINGVSGTAQTGAIVIAGSGGGGGVPDITGTADQVLVNGGSGSPVSTAVLLTLPQSIATTSTVQFGKIGVGGVGVLDLDVNFDRSGSPVYIRAKNTSSTPNSESVLLLQTATGDAYTHYSVNASLVWSVGVDYSDSTRFKFSSGSALGTNDVLTILSTAVYVNSALTIGSATPNANTQLSLNPTGQYGIYATSTMSQASAALYGIRLNNIIAPSTTFSAYGYAFTGTFNAASGVTVPGAYAFYSSVTASAAGGTIGALYNYFSAAGSSSVGTLTSFYGFFSAAPAIGTNRYSAYFNAPSGGTISIACYADNFCAGFAVTPPTNGAIISGNVSIGSSSANSQFNVGSSNQFQVSSTGKIGMGGAPLTSSNYYDSGTLTGTSGNLFKIHLAGSMGASSGTVNNVAMIYTYLNLAGNSATTSVAASIFVDSGATAGTVTTGYGIFVQPVGFGSVRYGLYLSAPTGGSTNYGYQLMGQGSFNTAAGNSATISMGASALTRILYVTGTQNPASGAAYAIQFEYTVSPSASNNAYTMVINTSFQSPAGGLGVCAGYYANIACTGSGTINEASSILVDNGVVVGPTLSTGYGIQVKSITYGSTRIGLYVAAPSGGATANIGYQLLGQGAFNGGVNSTSLMTISAGSTYNRLVYITGTVSPSANAVHAFKMDVTLTPASANNAFAMHVSPIITSGAGGLAICAAIYANYALAGSGTVTETAGVYVDTCDDSIAAQVTMHSGIKINSQTVGVTRYGIYVSAQSGGTTAICAFFGDAIQMGTSTTGSTTCTLGTNSPSTATTPTTWIPVITPAGTRGYVPVWV